MPCILKVHIGAASSLPTTTEAGELPPKVYVEIRLGPHETQQTGVSRGTRPGSPLWEEDLRLEIADDALLQEEPLELRVIDCGEASDGGLIGSVSIDLGGHVQRDIRERGGEEIAFTNNERSPSDRLSPDWASHDRPPHSQTPRGQSPPDLITDEHPARGGVPPNRHVPDHQTQDRSPGDRVGPDGCVLSEARLTWYPIYDTIWGIRGRLGLEVRLEFLEGSAEGCVGLDVGVYAASSPFGPRDDGKSPPGPLS